VRARYSTEDYRPAILAVTLLPESPRWCAATNQPDRAQQSLKNLRQGWEMVEVEAEYASLAAELDENQDHTFRSLFRGSSLVSSTNHLKLDNLTL
jgi:hypothetical protein